jgi:hypothetical protein
MIDTAFKLALISKPLTITLKKDGKENKTHTAYRCANAFTISAGDCSHCIADCDFMDWLFQIRMVSIKQNKI